MARTDYFLAGMMGLVVVFTVYAFTLLGVTATAQAGCYRSGWADGRATWRFERYCTRTVSATTETRPYALRDSR